MSTPFHLKLSNATLKKLRVYTILSDKSFDEVESDLVEQFDSMLSEMCMKKMMEMDGISIPQFSQQELRVKYASSGLEQAEREEKPVVREKSPPQEKSQENSEEFFMDSISGHELSGDDAEEETKSLQEQFEDDSYQAPQYQNKESDDGIKPFQINARNVGDDAEAFLNVALSENKATSSGRDRSASAGKAFNPMKPRVRVSEYSDDE